MKLYHGTDEDSAQSLVRGERLHAAKAAARKIDGAAGFFLATQHSDAEFFALRRGRGAVIQYNLSKVALKKLQAAGAVTRPIPMGARSPKFAGDELFVPSAAFEQFNDLLDQGEIKVST